MSVMYSPVLKYSDMEHQLRKNQEMDSGIGHPQQHCHQPNSGLLRYCSAPRSMLASLFDNTIHGCVNEESFTSENQQQQHYLPSTSSEMETMLSKLLPSNNGWSNTEALQEFGGGKPVKQEIGESVPQGPLQQNGGYSYGGSQLIYQSQQIQGLPNGSSSAGGNAFDNSFGVVNSMASENSIQSKMGLRNCSNLFRQKSSPAGFFSIENDLAALGDVGSFKANDVVSNGQATASTSGLHSTLTFSSSPSSCLKRMPQIAENENIESLGENFDQSRNLLNDNGTSKCYIPSFTDEFWDSSAFNAPKTENEDEIMFSTSNGLESQEADFRYQNLGLTHHLSLPSSSKMSSIEKFLQIQGSVPCKIRAKRGFATHPRSIAERVRRTRISERIKKLQDLFPRSEKQTSTADMLDLTVEYIKDLQQQVKMLSDYKTKCKCKSNEKHCTRTCA